MGFVAKRPLQTGLATHPHLLQDLCKLALVFPSGVDLCGFGSWKPRAALPLCLSLPLSLGFLEELAIRVDMVQVVPQITEGTTSW